MKLKTLFITLSLMITSASMASEIMEKTLIKDKGYAEREEVNAEEMCVEASMVEGDEIFGDKIEKSIQVIDASPLELARANGTFGWGAKCKIRITILN